MEPKARLNGKAERPSRGKVLIVLHREQSTFGRVGAILQNLGFQLDILRPPSRCDLPQCLQGYEGVVVFGGPMSANDKEEWIQREIDWLENVLTQDIPFLGLCLGAQMMARQLGARVYAYQDRRGEIGYYRLRPTLCGDELCHADFPRKAYQWHSEGFDLPRGAVCLAEGESDFPNQAFLYGSNVVGLQFHPEVTYHMICGWTVRGAERLGASGAASRDSQLAEWFRHDSAVANWISTFLKAWVSGALNRRNVLPERASYAVAAE